jgi:uncharacterized membrane protein YcaP (DUF421 family)
MTQEIIYVIALSIASLASLFFLTKLMGYRQMSQMSLFDYINGITIGSIAAEMATNLEDFHRPFAAMIVYALGTLALSCLTGKSIRARRFINGKPLVLMHNGTLYEENLQKAKMDVCELLEQCRISGYFDLSQLTAIVLEGNGQLSLLPKTEQRPATPQDLGLSPAAEDLCCVLVIDGHIMKHNLAHSGKNEKWLTAQLHDLGYKNVKHVLLATCDLDNKLTVFAKDDGVTPPDILD